MSESFDPPTRVVRLLPKFPFVADYLNARSHRRSVIVAVGADSCVEATSYEVVDFEPDGSRSVEPPFVTNELAQAHSHARIWTSTTADLVALKRLRLSQPIIVAVLNDEFAPVRVALVLMVQAASSVHQFFVRVLHCTGNVLDVSEPYEQPQQAILRARKMLHAPRPRRFENTA